MIDSIIDEALRKKISEWTDPVTNDCTAPEEERETYKELVLKGAEKNWPEALEALAYGSYGGNNIFPEDWEKAEACLLKLLEICEDPSPFYYNSLGYIYYYGRTNGGTPQYEKAFQYFSVGSIHGLFESTYKLADMLIAGQGVPKNAQAAVRLIQSIYAENRDHLENEDFDCKFADVALRLGNICENGIGVEKDPEGAYSLYLQARLAIRERRKAYDFHGDDAVEKNIEEALERCRKKLPEDFFRNTIYADHPYMISSLMTDSEGLDMAAARKDGVWFLLARRADANEDGIVKKHLFTLPKLDLCMLQDTIIMRIDGPHDVVRYTDTDTVYVNHIYFDEEEKTWYFMYQDYPMIAVSCEGFSFEL